MGHRNGHGLAVNPETGEMWETEQGPSGGDEVNILRPGRNYGWPVVSFGRDYWGPKMIQRIFRFNSVLMHAQTSSQNWTSLCHQAGYSDQSHFIKDFKQFTGLTPKMFLAQRPKDWMLLKESR